MKPYLKPILILCIFIFLSACGEASTTSTAETSTPEVTSTPDPCIESNLPNEVAKLDRLMREFEDYSLLASNTPHPQLVVVIPDLQRVLRESEEQTVPACLTNLKLFQTQHMHAVVQTLLAFMSNSVDANLVSASITKAREFHMQYDVEKARLLGFTFQAPTPATPSSSVTQTSPSSAITITNAGQDEINIWEFPSYNSPVIGVLPIQGKLVALGKSEDNQWIQVEIPNQAGKTAWVIASIVQLSVPLEQLPTVKP